MVVDGGLGIELERRGFVYTTNLWSGEAVLSRPDLLAAVHGAYLAAGARIIETATYQLAHPTLRSLGYDEPAIDAIFARAVQLAREAIARHLAGGGAAGPFIVAASLGPYGATLGDGSEYRGAPLLERDALYAFHAERLRAVVRAGPDVVWFETIPTQREARIVAEAARDLGVGRVWLSLACADGEHTFGGDRAGAVFGDLAGFDGIEAIGVNCTAPAAISPLIRALRAVSAKPIVVCPNAGQHWEAGGLAGGADDAELIGHVPEWLALGAAHVGGCCGVGPATIGRIAAIAASAASAGVR